MPPYSKTPLDDQLCFSIYAASIAINRAYCNWQFFARYRDALLQNAVDRKSTRLNSSHMHESRMPSSA